jgi:catalase
MDQDARDRLVDNVVGHLLNGVEEPVLGRAFEYWERIDPGVGKAIRDGLAGKAEEADPKAADQGNPARSDMQQKA